MTLQEEWAKPDPRSDNSMTSDCEFYIIYGRMSYISGIACKELWAHDTLSADGDNPTYSLSSFNVINATWQTLSHHIYDYGENILPPLIDSCIFIITNLYTY
ncbi:hypothetical protein RF11_09138 [Thelohanellus kitauei]|uniref:Uncharacterized protein n=1 Tax=Thelohanellus kitauei TaxID=669202 RepID=A0A0C2J0N2_THEKT|nr:hypothetical protein RF11_09138 [Thelohanellus kitauei]